MNRKKMYDLAILIEDNDINSLVAQSILMNSGYFKQSVILPSGFSALQYLEKHSHSENHNVVFLDIKMPQISGFEFLEKFEALPESIRQSYTLIVLSGNNYEKELISWKEKKLISGTLLKPLNNAKLEQLINSLPELI